MANSDYKPLFTGGGGGGDCVWVVTTTDKLPNPGITGKIYVCTDTGEQKYWDVVATEYKVLGSMSGAKYKYQGGIAAFPDVGEEGKYYIDEITGYTYIWSSKSGHPAFTLPNFMGYNPGTNPPFNVIFFTNRDVKTNLRVVNGDDTQGRYITLTINSVFSAMVIFKDPITGAQSPCKDIAPYIIYYDPDNPIIDRNQLPVPYGDMFVICLPKSYNLTKWTYQNLIALVTDREFNYSLFMTDRASGSYVRVD